MLRRLLIAVLLLIVAAVVVLDRVGARVAGHVLAGQLQSDEHLPSRPSATIGGIPFLTQAFGGNYEDVRITAHDFRTPDGVPVTTLKAHLRGAHIPFSKVVQGSVETVPVDHVDGTAFVSFADIAHYLAGQGTTVTLTRSSPSAINVIRKIPLGNRTGIAKGVARVTVSRDVITLRVASIDSTSIVGGKSGSRTFLLRPFSLSVPLRALPFRIHLTSVSVGTDGVTAAGRANDVTLGS